MEHKRISAVKLKHKVLILYMCVNQCSMITSCFHVVRPEPKSNSGALHNTLADYGKHPIATRVFCLVIHLHGFCSRGWLNLWGHSQPSLYTLIPANTACKGAVIAPLDLCEASLAPPVVRRAGNHEPNLQSNNLRMGETTNN